MFTVSGHVHYAGGHEVALRHPGAVRRLLPLLSDLRRLLLDHLLHVRSVQPYGRAGLQALHRAAGQLLRRLPLLHGDAEYVVLGHDSLCFTLLGRCKLLCDGRSG